MTRKKHKRKAKNSRKPSRPNECYKCKKWCEAGEEFTHCDKRKRLGRGLASLLPDESSLFRDRGGPYDRERAMHIEPVKMTITSKAPSKWRFVDMETGEVYKYQPNGKGQFASASCLELLRALLTPEGFKHFSRP